MLDKQLDRLAREPFAIPSIGKATRDPTNLRATQRELIVVELLTESHGFGSRRVERKVYDHTLRSGTAQRYGERRIVAPALKHHVGTTIASRVCVPLFYRDGWVAITGVERHKSKRCSHRQSVLGLINDDDFCGAARAGKQSSEQPHDTRTDNNGHPSSHTVAECAHIGADGIGSCR